MNVHILYVLELKTSKKEFPSVCMYIRLCVPSWCTITFEGVSASKQILVDVFYV